MNTDNKVHPCITVNKYGLKSLNKDYFLTFSTKEEYLLKRSEWRYLYNLVSDELRNNKLYWKWTCRYYSKPKVPFIFPDPFPRLKKEWTRLIYAPQFLELRHKMKILSAKQREESLIDKD